jgi:hypothetical protein
MKTDVMAGNTIRRWLLNAGAPLLATVCFTGIAVGAELTRVELSNEGNVYSIRLEMNLDIAARYVKEVLTDYPHIYRLNPSIVDSRVLPSAPDGAARVLTRVEGCVLFHCVEVTRVEDVYEKNANELTAVIVPELSDFWSGTALWRITQEGSKSRLVYEAQVEPEIFIPPLVGSYFVKKQFKEEMVTTFQHIECNATTRWLMDEAGGDRTVAEVKGHQVC